MTNTNDFRQYSYQQDPSYLIRGFDLSRGSQAPKYRPQDEAEPKIKVHQNNAVKSKAQLNAEQKSASRTVAITIGIALLCLAMIAAAVSSMALKNEATRHLSKMQIELSEAESENVSLRSQIDAMVSISMIDDYAVNELGMSKMKADQIQYMDVGEYMAKAKANANVNSKQTNNQLKAKTGNK